MVRCYWLFFLLTFYRRYWHQSCTNCWQCLFEARQRFAYYSQRQGRPLVKKQYIFPTFIICFHASFRRLKKTQLFCQTKKQWRHCSFFWQHFWLRFAWQTSLFMTIKIPPIMPVFFLWLVCFGLIIFLRICDNTLWVWLPFSLQTCLCPRKWKWLTLPKLALILWFHHGRHGKQNKFHM